jgi:hypothetical protein
MGVNLTSCDVFCQNVTEINPTDSPALGEAFALGSRSLNKHLQASIWNMRPGSVRRLIKAVLAIS